MYDNEYEWDILLFLRILKYLHTSDADMVNAIIRDYPEVDEEDPDMIMYDLLWAFFDEEPEETDDEFYTVRFSDQSVDRLYQLGCQDGDTPMFYYPFSNVYEDERVCTGNNILPRYKKLSAMKNFPRYLLGLPDNDDMFYSAHNQKGLDHKALLEHLKDKDPSYYYTDILVPNGRTLSDFILRR